MLFDWLITGQVVPTNPAAAVRGPKHVVKTGKMTVLEAAEWRKRRCHGNSRVRKGSVYR
jgi:site-specific recombinase XerC